jgi:cell division protein FtsB
MGLGNRRKPSRLVRALMVIMALMIIPLGVEYTRQSVLKQQWQDAEAQLLQERATAQAVHDQLEERKAYVQTDAYVAEAARGRLRLARQGEVLVALVGTAPAVPIPTLQLTPTPSPTPTPQSWWASLFGR